MRVESELRVNQNISMKWFSRIFGPIFFLKGTYTTTARSVADRESSFDFDFRQGLCQAFFVLGDTSAKTTLRADGWCLNCCRGDPKSKNMLRFLKIDD